MSLILRQKAQVILDNAGLNNLHARINDDKYVSLCGECGKPHATIHGIQFTRSNPGAAEIDYACELLDAFLVKHVEIVKQAVQLATKLNELVKARPESDECAIYGSGRYDTARVVLTREHGQLRLSFTKSTEHKDRRLYVRAEWDEYVPIKVFSTFKIAQEDIALAEKLLDLEEERDKVQQELNEVTNRLRTCDI